MTASSANTVPHARRLCIHDGRLADRDTLVVAEAGGPAIGGRMAAQEVHDDVEALNAFIDTLKNDYERLYADFASVLVAQGGVARIPIDVRQIPLARGRIERRIEPATRAAIFRFLPDTP